MNRPLALVGVLFALALAPVSAQERKLPYPEGKSEQEHAGLKFHLELPYGYDPAGRYALIVGLHGMGASNVEFATWLEPLLADDFIVCCPKSTGSAWNKADVDKAKAIVEHLLATLAIDPARVHGIGFSNGGAHLPFLVFDPKLPFATGCWMGSGFGGGKVPRRAKTQFGAIALVGSEDPAYGAAKGTVDRLRGKVKRVEFREEPELGHEISRTLMSYYYYWLAVMEGRFTPGDEASFEWHYGMGSAKMRMEDEKRGGFVFFYSDGDRESADAKHLEHVVLFDEVVRHFGRQLVPVMIQREHDPALFASMGFTKTPAIAVLKPDGTVAKTFEGRIEIADLAKAFRAFARDRSLPR